MSEKWTVELYKRSCNKVNLHFRLEAIPHHSSSTLCRSIVPLRLSSAATSRLSASASTHFVNLEYPPSQSDRHSRAPSCYSNAIPIDSAHSMKEAISPVASHFLRVLKNIVVRESVDPEINPLDSAPSIISVTVCSSASSPTQHQRRRATRGLLEGRAKESMSQGATLRE